MPQKPYFDFRALNITDIICVQLETYKFGLNDPHAQHFVLQPMSQELYLSFRRELQRSVLGQQKETYVTTIMHR